MARDKPLKAHDSPLSALCKVQCQMVPAVAAPEMTAPPAPPGRPSAGRSRWPARALSSAPSVPHGMTATNGPPVSALP